MRKREKSVKPLKKREDVARVAEHLRKSYRNGEMIRLLFLTGCNTGLRASDIRRLRYSDFKHDSFIIAESKTGKERKIYINAALREAYENYFVQERETGGRAETRRLVVVNEDAPIFNGMHGGGGMCAQYMHFVIADACSKLGIRGRYGSHTMRKTFAYHAYRLTRDLKRVQSVLRHSDIGLTRKYVGLKGIDLGAKNCGLEDGEVYAVNLR